ncbi:hypothetical protein SKAU_G00324140 [Synaphobranchus kaupii]|uniref:Uncharacterized protein n=1 Tax=Synaphobranchus kaupii TaxID=118154 RepID=A0A9Q1EPF3_SYNKA|nr:hypothetical protein SKAU_G00324140 [Synaphobranchus kaupii]
MREIPGRSVEGKGDFKITPDKNASEGDSHSGFSRAGMFAVATAPQAVNRARRAKRGKASNQMRNRGKRLSSLPQASQADPDQSRNGAANISSTTVVKKPNYPDWGRASNVREGCMLTVWERCIATAGPTGDGRNPIKENGRRTAGITVMGLSFEVAYASAVGGRGCSLKVTKGRFIERAEASHGRERGDAPAERSAVASQAARRALGRDECPRGETQR